MPFYLSPSVNVFEKDLTSIVPAVSTSIGAFAGAFAWGPVEDPVTVSSENVLVQRFGKPNDSCFHSFFTAANFLSYSNNLLLIRADATGLRNACAEGSSEVSVKIKNEDDYNTNYHQGDNGIGAFAAKYPGTQGNSLVVSMCDSGNFSTWEYKGQFDSAPGTSEYVARLGGSDDEIHIVVVDSTGQWSGTAGTVLEKFAFVSKASDASKSDGTNNYYKNVVNLNSKYVWWTDHLAGVANWGSSAQDTEFDTLNDEINATFTLSGGADDYNVSVIPSYEILANDELYDISLVMCGMVLPSVAQEIVQKVAEARKDCVAFVSPSTNKQPIIGNSDSAVDAILAYKTAMNLSSSYAVMDTGCKYQYDRYNDVYRWVPLNGDIAGLCARTDYTNDAWWSPAGYNRGQIKSVVKLAVNPGKTERDNLYKNGVNPVVNFPGNGVVLFGDKTMLAKPSAFDRINVRRLFIVLEKAIATAAKYQLFEFNDGFTRAQFKNLVEPFLRDVQGRRGIIDFRVKCDEANNTGEVIDRNEFVADIFIKPSRAINFITLNFIAARTSISFEEIGA